MNLLSSMWMCTAGLNPADLQQQISTATGSLCFVANSNDGKPNPWTSGPRQNNMQPRDHVATDQETLLSNSPAVILLAKSSVARLLALCTLSHATSDMGPPYRLLLNAPHQVRLFQDSMDWFQGKILTGNHCF
jgi:hypothetical protein